MPEMNVRSDAVDVEQIMRQIRTRIREKRGADYTEAELQQLATVKLEKFLDPAGLRSDLLQHFLKKQAATPPPLYEFTPDSLFDSHRGVVRAIRKLFRPILKLFFNADRLAMSLHLQTQINAQLDQRLRNVESLSYELLHNMTIEITRLGIEVHNLKMRVESLSSRVDFDERRAKALEGVVQYRTPPVSRQTPAATGGSSPEAAGAGAPAAGAGAAASGGGAGSGGDGERRRRRRRRRRRPGQTMAEAQGQNWAGSPGADQNGSDADGDGGADDDAATDDDAAEPTDQ